MKVDPKIKFSQLLLLLFISMLFPFMLISGSLLSHTGIWSFVIWAALTVLQVPVLYFISNRVLLPEKSAINIIIRIVAAVFLLITAVRFIVMFSDFFSEMINTSAQPWFVAAVMLAFSGYSVVRGIRGLSASSIIFSALTVLMLVLLVIGGASEVNFEHLFMAFGNDGDLLDFTLTVISFNFIFPLVLILNADTGKPKTSAVIWVPLALAAAEALIVFLTLSCLGEYAFTQPYPIMSLFRAPTLNILESVSGVWFLTLTVLGLAALSSCLCGISTLTGAPRSKGIACISALAVFAGYLLDEFGAIDSGGRIWVYISAALSVISALLCLIKSKRKTTE